MELEETKALAAEFGRAGGVGEKLQKLLEKRAEERDSWVRMCMLFSGLWLDMVGPSSQCLCYGTHVHVHAHVAALSSFTDLLKKC